MVLVKLVLAHLIGDFFLQPNSWVKSKIENKWRSPALYAHVLVHSLLIFLIFWDLNIWIPVVLIAFSHFVIDGIKVSFQKEHTRMLWFGLDQCFHLGVLVAVWILFWEISFSVHTESFWAIITGALFLTVPSSVIMQKVMSRWGDEIEDDKSSLKGAGNYIGMLERILIFIAILTGTLQVIGFLLAAKSVFRFGDLTRSSDRKLTEYILVGTLLSFLIAIITGLIILEILG